MCKDCAYYQNGYCAASGSSTGEYGNCFRFHRGNSNSNDFEVPPHKVADYKRFEREYGERS